MSGRTPGICIYQIMDKEYYLKALVEEIHGVTVATVDSKGHPETRIIDMMLYDEKGVYFLTAKGKVFYDEICKQKYIALSGTKDRKAISLKGKVKNIGKEKLDEIFEKNEYMKKIYPKDTRDALEVFVIYEAEGEYFDISNPSKIVRDSFVIGDRDEVRRGYFVTDKCIGCGSCLQACPQNCILMREDKAFIDKNHCLHCGRCISVCPVGAIERRDER